MLNYALLYHSTIILFHGAGILLYDTISGGRKCQGLNSKELRQAGFDNGQIPGAQCERLTHYQGRCRARERYS